MGNTEEEDKNAPASKVTARKEEKLSSIVVQSTKTSIKVPPKINWSGNMVENWSFFKQILNTWSQVKVPMQIVNI